MLIITVYSYYGILFDRRVHKICFHAREPYQEMKIRNKKSCCFNKHQTLIYKMKGEKGWLSRGNTDSLWKCKVQYPYARLHVYFRFCSSLRQKKAHQPFEKSKRSGYTKVWFSVKKYVVILFAMFPNINVHLNLQNDTDFI